MAEEFEAEGSPAPRYAVRAIVMDEEGAGLLFRASQTVTRTRRPLWMMPGGGLKPGEQWEAAIVRELYEETGRRFQALGPWVWTRRVSFSLGGAVMRQEERYYLVRCERFEPVPAALDEGEDVFIEDQRWWTAEEIRASDDWFAPRRMAELVAELAAGRLPSSPIDCGV